ncbi:GNAT family N-acetyltransferase [Pseudoflavonifractor phocaeensis]|uniref:GNAT family N-acetyltransferase n=1 Tax=Pseudoflavonifractor phocaeensis TaxID=1870988 RepID=UPI00195E8A1F|nr:GNAT family N-acetyltransferase [Pseudoflavonifractor phocaeensis]MBM6870078.1 GNAT family N-acetyltransferase [Pseudoflavonifractor phocaeensis]
MRIRERLAAEPVRYADLLTALDRPETRLVWNGAEGAVLWEARSGAYMAVCLAPGGEEETAAHVPPAGTLVTCHDAVTCRLLRRRLGLTQLQVCVQAVWTAKEPPQVPPFGGTLKRLGEEWTQTVYDRYSQHYGNLEEIRQSIRQGMLGAFVEGELAGFIGVHLEGSLGMLEVLPPFRRRGVGRMLLAGGIALALEQGRTPFSQIMADNRPSLALHRGLGMDLSPERMYWLF